MSLVLRLLALVAVVGLVPAGVAFADHLEPEKRIRPADQARARSILLRAADVPGAVAQRGSGGEPHLTCSALDESDLTVTGDAKSTTWTWGATVVSSAATLYASERDAATAWRRGTSAAGLRCLRSELGRAFLQLGARPGSLSRISFPRVAPRTAVYRLALTVEAQGQRIRMVLDFVVLMRGRAQAGLVVASVLPAAARTAEVQLSRTIAARMARAMRSS